MKGFERFVPQAINLLKEDSGRSNSDFFCRDPENGVLAKGVYEGYIASFGTMVKTAGLLPAVLIFSDTSGRGDQSKRPVVEAILKIIKDSRSEWSNASSLLELVKDNPRNPVLRKAVMDAAVALKLAFRTFKMDK